MKWMYFSTATAPTWVKFTKKRNQTSNLPDFEFVGESISTDVLNFKTTIDKAYDEIVKWKSNLFSVPRGQCGKAFIEELTKWLEHFNEFSDYQCVALKVFMKEEHKRKLQERLELWKDGNINFLLKEGKTIQKRLKESKSSKKQDTARTFANLMFHGKVSAAVRFLQIDENVIKELEIKHPSSYPIAEGKLLYGPIADVPLCYFDHVDEAMITRATLRTKGACGPSSMNAEQYRLILTNKYFKTHG